MVEKIANDVSNKLITQSKCSHDFAGIEAHIEAINLLCSSKSNEAAMVGIWGQSGIGKSTIGRALFSQLSIQFPLRIYETYKSTDLDVSGMKSRWEESFLSKILGQKELKLDHFGVLEQRFKDKKVLIVLDDVDNLEVLKTLVGKTEWFGPGSRIIVITQDRQLLKAHDIDLIYEVKLPSQGLSLKMICRSAFGKDSPPDDFMELAVEVAKLAGNLPLGLSVLGSSLKGRDKDEWMEMMTRLRTDLDGKIETTIRVGYDRLDRKDRVLFLCIACFFNGFTVGYVQDFLEDKVGIKSLTDKSLIRITPSDTIEMHNLLQKLGIQIVLAESKGNTGKRPFLTDLDFEDIRQVLGDITGTETVLGIRLSRGILLSIDEKPSECMRKLPYLVVNSWSNVDLPRALVYLPHKLRTLEWRYCPLKCFPSKFKAEYLVELNLICCALEKLWEGTQPLGSLKKMIMDGSIYLKEIPDLSYAINLEELYLTGCESLLTLSDFSNAKNLETVYLSGCISLVTLPSSIQNAIKLRKLDMRGCTKLESFPTPLNLESLEYLDLTFCHNLRNFPEIIMKTSTSSPHGIEIEVGDCFWYKNLLPGLDYLDCLTGCMPCKFRPEHLVHLDVRGNKMLEKLWEGVQSLGSLKWINLSKCTKLTEIPDLSKATSLEYLNLSKCKSLVMLPSTIGNLQTLRSLEMEKCTRLEVLPTDVNLSSLEILNLSGCSSLTSFPLISRNIKWLYLQNTAIEEVPCCIENFSRLAELTMCGCQRLRNICPNIFKLTYLEKLDFTDCGGVVTALREATVMGTTEDHFSCISTGGEYFKLLNHFKLDVVTREFIVRSCFMPTVLLGGQMPTYFTHRAHGDSLSVTLPQSSFSQEFLLFKACVAVDFPTEGEYWYAYLEVNVLFNGRKHQKLFFEDAKMQLCKTDLLLICSFKFEPQGLPSKKKKKKKKGLPSKLAFNDVVEFKFSYYKRIKECGVRLLNVFPSPDDSDGSSQTEYNQQQSGENCDVVGTALCVDSMITEQQDAVDAHLDYLGS